MRHGVEYGGVQPLQVAVGKIEELDMGEILVDQRRMVDERVGLKG